MSPPEVWGPAIWTLFHTLIEKLNPDAYPHVINSLFNVIVRICKLLPCPECSNHATKFLAKIKLSDYKSKNDFKNMLYLFHNYVNTKKRKKLFNYANLNKYENLNLTVVINNFIKHYNTKGNMNLLAESFQRSFVIKDFIKWIKYYSRAFTKHKIIQNPKKKSEIVNVTENSEKTDNIVEENSENIVQEDIVEENTKKTVEEDIVEKSENIVENSENIVEKNTVIKETSQTNQENHEYNNKINQEITRQNHIVITEKSKKRKKEDKNR
jgi:hypothetical protein